METETIGLIDQVMKKIRMNQWINDLLKEEGNKKRWLKLKALCPEIKHWTMFHQNKLVCRLNEADGKVFRICPYFFMSSSKQYCSVNNTVRKTSCIVALYQNCPFLDGENLPQ